MSIQIPEHPDPKINALIQGCAQHLLNPDGQGVRKALDPKAHQSEPTADQMQEAYDAACRLCDSGNFKFAVPIALHLSTAQPTNPRFSFLAATCLQRLGHYPNAAQLFCFTLLHGGNDVATLYRIGECLLAVGDDDNAAKALEAAFDLSRESPDTAELQSLAAALIRTARQSA